MPTSKRKRASSTSAGEKHHELTIAEKLDVLHDMDAKISYRKLAEKYNVSLGSLSKIAKNRDKIENEAADSANLQLKRPRRQIYGHQQLCSGIFSASQSSKSSNDRPDVARKSR